MTIPTLNKQQNENNINIYKYMIDIKHIFNVMWISYIIFADQL